MSKLPSGIPEILRVTNSQLDWLLRRTVAALRGARGSRKNPTNYTVKEGAVTFALGTSQLVAANPLRRLLLISPRTTGQFFIGTSSAITPSAGIVIAANTQPFVVDYEHSPAACTAQWFGATGNGGTIYVLEELIVDSNKE